MLSAMATGIRTSVRVAESGIATSVAARVRGRTVGQPPTASGGREPYRYPWLRVSSCRLAHHGLARPAEWSRVVVAPVAAPVDPAAQPRQAEHGPPPDADEVRRRGRRGPGVPIIPSRVRQARIERGLSLADLAGMEVSRAFIHQLEQGLARPSLQVLEVIANRTGKPLDYFTSGEAQPTGGPDLSSGPGATSQRLERLSSTLELRGPHHEALRVDGHHPQHRPPVIPAL